MHGAPRSVRLLAARTKKRDQRAAALTSAMAVPSVRTFMPMAPPGGVAPPGPHAPSHAPPPKRVQPVRRATRPRRRGGALGRTQYTLVDTHGRASAAMKALRPVHTYPPSPPPRAASPTPRVDPLAVFAADARAQPLAPAHVEGLGRVLIHRALLRELGHTAPSRPAPPAPQYTHRERAERAAAVRRWLGDAESEPSEPPPAQPRTTYHPMVAKALRERSRRSRVPQARRRDLWIAPDGRRINCRARMRTARVSCNLRTLAASGISPVIGCRCGFRDEHMDLVQCDGCRHWLHLSCVGVCSVQQLGDGEWLCDDCYESTTALGGAAPRARGGLAATLAAPPSPGHKHVAGVPARTPSPAPLELAFSTPSRAPVRIAPVWMSPTPAAPRRMIDTPLDLWATPQRALLGSHAPVSPWPDSPLARSADAWSSPPALSRRESIGVPSSSPFPTTPTWSREHSDAGYTMNARMDSADAPTKHTGDALLPPLAANGIV